MELSTCRLLLATAEALSALIPAALTDTPVSTVPAVLESVMPWPEWRHLQTVATTVTDFFNRWERTCVKAGMQDRTWRTCPLLIDPLHRATVHDHQNLCSQARPTASDVQALITHAKLIPVLTRLPIVKQLEEWYDHASLVLKCAEATKQLCAGMAEHAHQVAPSTLAVALGRVVDLHRALGADLRSFTGDALQVAIHSVISIGDLCSKSAIDLSRPGDDAASWAIAAHQTLRSAEHLVTAAFLPLPQDFALDHHMESLLASDRLEYLNQAGLYCICLQHDNQGLMIGCGKAAASWLGPLVTQFQIIVGCGSMLIVLDSMPNVSQCDLALGLIVLFVIGLRTLEEYLCPACSQEQGAPPSHLVCAWSDLHCWSGVEYEFVCSVALPSIPSSEALENALAPLKHTSFCTMLGSIGVLDKARRLVRVLRLDVPELLPC